VACAQRGPAQTKEDNLSLGLKIKSGQYTKKKSTNFDAPHKGSLGSETSASTAKVIPRFSGCGGAPVRAAQGCRAPAEAPVAEAATKAANGRGEAAIRFIDR
jgi:hypothetical protein